MNSYIEIIKTYLIGNQPGNGEDEMESVLEQLYQYYTEFYCVNSEGIQSSFAHLNQVLDKLSLNECDQVWDAVCKLCNEHEHAAFLEGIHIGARLMTELSLQEKC